MESGHYAAQHIGNVASKLDQVCYVFSPFRKEYQCMWLNDLLNLLLPVDNLLCYKWLGVIEKCEEEKEKWLKRKKLSDTRRKNVLC